MICPGSGRTWAVSLASPSRLHEPLSRRRRCMDSETCVPEWIVYGIYEHVLDMFNRDTERKSDGRQAQARHILDQWTAGNVNSEFISTSVRGEGSPTQRDLRSSYRCPMPKKSRRPSFRHLTKTLQAIMWDADLSGTEIMHRLPASSQPRQRIGASVSVVKSVSDHGSVRH